MAGEERMIDPTIVTPGRRPDRPRPIARPRARDGRRATDTRPSGDVLSTSPLFVGGRT